MGRSRWIVICLAFGLLGTISLGQSDPDIVAFFAKLNQPSTTDQAARQVLETATKSSKAREYVVQRLPGMIEKPESDEIWLNAVRLAGQLKAVESIPSLQKALSRGPLGGLLAYSMTAELRLENDVVAKALSQIGEAAIPAATNLLASEDQKTRRRAVLILRNMGTPAARKAMQICLAREADPTIRELIENGLSSSK
jgi:HEAT repeat protein